MIGMKTERIGRMAVFNIPASKWDNSMYTQRNKPISKLVDEFLIANYNGYTIQGPFEGRWRPKKGEPTHKENMMVIKASFKGKDRIPKLQKFLAGMCRLMNEECLYMETGEDAWLIYP